MTEQAERFLRVCIRMVCPDITHARLDRMIHDYEATS